MAPTAVICNLSRRAPHISEAELKLRHIPTDLSDPEQIAKAVTSVLHILNAEAPNGRVLLINNSGFGIFGRFLESKIDQQLGMIDVNIRAVVELTSRLLPTIIARRGGIINIASTAAFQPTPLIATYGATKAFVLHWTLALREELRGSGVRVLAVCPGPTNTEFAMRAGLESGVVTPGLGQTPQEIAAESLRAWAADRGMVVNGWRNRALARVASLAPKNLAAFVAARVIRRATGRDQ